MFVVRFREGAASGVRLSVSVDTSRCTFNLHNWNLSIEGIRLSKEEMEEKLDDDDEDGEEDGEAPELPTHDARDGEGVTDARDEHDDDL